MYRKRGLGVFMCCVMVCAGVVAADNGLTKSTIDLKYAGPLAFGPDGVLFVGDSQAATIYAIDTGDKSGNPEKVQHNLEQLDAMVAAALGTKAEEVLINDLAVNPLSGNVYLSVSRGRGPDAAQVLLKVDGQGDVSELSLKNVKSAKATLPNAPEDKETGEGRRRRNPRRESITDLTFADGQLLVAGLSNEEFASKLRAIDFPFKTTDKGTSVEVFHGAHGRLETRSPVRTFAAYTLNEKPHVVAAYTCTPLVVFPLSDLAPGKKVQGRTVAELGNRNRPLDMIVYEKDGKDFILMANSSRGVMKITTDGLSDREGIDEKVSGTAGQTYDTIEGLKGVEQLDRLNSKNAVVLVKTEAGLNLQTVALP